MATKVSAARPPTSLDKARALRQLTAVCADETSAVIAAAQHAAAWVEHRAMAGPYGNAQTRERAMDKLRETWLGNDPDVLQLLANVWLAICTESERCYGGCDGPSNDGT